MLESYSIQPVRKDTLDEEFSRGAKITKNDQLSTQPSTKGKYCKQVILQPCLSKNPRPTTLCDYGTTIKDDTNCKAIKDFTNQNMVELLTAMWVQHMLRIWNLIFVVRIIRIWYLQLWISSIQTFNNIHPKIEMERMTTQVNNSLYTSIEFQQHDGLMNLIIHTNAQRDQKYILISRARVKSNFKFYWRGPRKADPKKLEETATQGSYLLVDSSTTCKNPTHLYKRNITSQHNYLQIIIEIQEEKEELITLEFNNGTRLPQEKLAYDKAYTIRWAGHITARSLTKLTTLIMSGIWTTNLTQCEIKIRLSQNHTLQQCFQKASQSLDHLSERATAVCRTRVKAVSHLSGKFSELATTVKVKAVY